MSTRTRIFLKTEILRPHAIAKKNHAKAAGVAVVTNHVILTLYTWSIVDENLM